MEQDREIDATLFIMGKHTAGHCGQSHEQRDSGTYSCKMQGMYRREQVMITRKK